MRFRIVVFLLIMFNAISGQHRDAGILSDNAKLAEYMYLHMHYPLMAMVKIYQLWKVLQDMPEFPGGNDAMIQFIAENLKWPPEAAEMGIQGRIICGFVIEKDGFVSLVEVKRPLDRLFDAEAMRVIKRMPPWKPGKINGKPVRVYYVLPVNIRM